MLGYLGCREDGGRPAGQPAGQPACQRAKQAKQKQESCLSSLRSHRPLRFPICKERGRSASHRAAAIPSFLPFFFPSSPATCIDSTGPTHPPPPPPPPTYPSINVIMNPMSPIEDVKVAMCLSPQDKLKGSGLLVQRSGKKDAKDNFAVTKDAVLLDVDMDSGWISDDNLRAMDFDDRLNQDIDWVVHDDTLDMSLVMDFEPDSDDHDVVNDFGFGPTSYLSPLRGGLLTFEDSSEVSSSFECVNLELPERSATDAEKLLMSFDTMNFTIPSPTSSSSKKRASLFAKRDQGKLAQARSSSATSTGSMSPSPKLKVSARALTAEELQEEQAAAKAALSSSSADPFLGVLNITAPSSEQLLGGENARKIGSYSPAARKLRIQKFHEKRKNRTWKKSIKYDCRKKLADDRPRIKGRFVRVLENMCDMKDDEPMSPTGDMSPASISSFTPPVTPMSSPEPVTSLKSSPMVPAAMAMKIPAPAIAAPTQAPVAAPVLSLVVPVQALSASTAAIASLVASTS